MLHEEEGIADSLQGIGHVSQQDMSPRDVAQARGAEGPVADGVHLGLDKADQLGVRQHFRVGGEDKRTPDCDEVVEAVLFPDLHCPASVAAGANRIAQAHLQPCKEHVAQRQTERSPGGSNCLRSLAASPAPAFALRHPALKTGHAGEAMGGRRRGIVRQGPQR